jgi:SAM-dependent methyltransferase
MILHMDVQFWDQRYAAHEFVYGQAPNEFLREQLTKLKPGLALFPAEGEGRNALYAASLGWTVFAFDQSKVARDKALALAAERNITIRYDVKGLDEFRGDHTYDMVGLFYVHMPSDLRHQVHAELLKALKPGGVVILECFSERQLEHDSGGPKDPDMLMNIDKLLNDFSGLDHLLVAESLVTLDEGTFHRGTASVMRLTGQKP